MIFDTFGCVCAIVITSFLFIPLFLHILVFLGIDWIFISLLICHFFLSTVLKLTHYYFIIFSLKFYYAY